MPGAPDVSLVVPVYNERENLAPLVTEIARALGPADGRYEIVAVDDGSTDGSLQELKALKRAHPELHIVSFAANAGQSAAFAAGFRAARGRTVVTLDADLQNDPADIPALLAELERSGATAVAGYRVNRRDTFWKRLQSRIANDIRNRLNHETIRDTGCSLKAFRADAVRALDRLLFDEGSLFDAPATATARPFGAGYCRRHAVDGEQPEMAQHPLVVHAPQRRVIDVCLGPRHQRA